MNTVAESSLPHLDLSYPGAPSQEHEDMIPVLLAQTQCTFPHERQLLRELGLRPGMRFADICCGCGDFAALVAAEFRPSACVAVDRNDISLAHARRSYAGVNYLTMDATALDLPSNHFDFVTCRHALQVFDRPQAILSELVRICRPGGTVYVTGEKNSACFGSPGDEQIDIAYGQVVELCQEVGMDLENGPKLPAQLAASGLIEVGVQVITITNRDRHSAPQSFAKVVESWATTFGRMARASGRSGSWRRQLETGLQRHAAAIRDPAGHAGWPVWVCTALKP